MASGRAARARGVAGGERGGGKDAQGDHLMPKRPCLWGCGMLTGQASYAFRHGPPRSNPARLGVAAPEVQEANARGDGRPMRCLWVHRSRRSAPRSPARGRWRSERARRTALPQAPSARVTTRSPDEIAPSLVRCMRDVRGSKPAPTTRADGWPSSPRRTATRDAHSDTR